MLIRTSSSATREQKEFLKRRLAGILPGARARTVRGGLEVSGFRPASAADAAPLLENIPGVAGTRLTQRELCPLVCAAGRALPAKPLNFRKDFIFIAGPCAVEDEASYLASAAALKAAGAHALRAALFKPRSSPYAFQGVGFDGLKTIARAKKLTGLPLVTEITDTRQAQKLCAVCDVLQIGARNMRNYELLKEAGRSGLPVLLKRAMRATLGEWLLSAEYLLKYGTRNLVLCERGDAVLSSDSPGLDLAMLREAKRLTGLPVIADPSHSTHDRGLAASLALKAARAGADGLLIEASLSPQTARVDGRQTLTARTFAKLAGAILCRQKQ
ncbi:MAG TPA: 3-deoxy-7-phosphoheptulonate synthase [Elusimicrobia bacterium]|nr:3-deoxy-7-phosphoheptulonate synthase [Elusimicrobiota bacterium]